MLRSLEDELTHTPTRDKVCRGTILSREQYLVDTLERVCSRQHAALPAGSAVGDEEHRQVVGQQREARE